MNDSRSVAVAHYSFAGQALSISGQAPAAAPFTATSPLCSMRLFTAASSVTPRSPSNTPPSFTESHGILSRGTVQSTS